MSANGNLTMSDIPGILTPFSNQVRTEAGCVTFVNTFTVASEEAIPAFLDHWVKDASSMKSQYGMLSAQLYRNIGEKSNVFINVAVWESTAAFREAFSQPAFQESLNGFPKGTQMTPLIMTKVAIPGICTV